MKKFSLTWGKGSVLGIDIVYKTINIEADCINEIDPTIILPESIKGKIFYIRIIRTSETTRNYDYGSWSEFIEAKEIK